VDCLPEKLTKEAGRPDRGEQFAIEVRRETTAIRAMLPPIGIRLNTEQGYLPEQRVVDHIKFAEEFLSPQYVS